jgi:hypothetical protein
MAWTIYSADSFLSDNYKTGIDCVWPVRDRFYTCSSTPVEIKETTDSYTSIQSAYDVAANGQSILVQALPLTESPNLTRDIDIKLFGGYECNFPLNAVSSSTIYGSLTIAGGAATIENLIIK